jgi:hypothetical protein
MQVDVFCRMMSVLFDLLAFDDVCVIFLHFLSNDRVYTVHWSTSALCTEFMNNTAVNDDRAVRSQAI